MPRVSVSAGELRDRVTWFRPVRTRKEGGQAVTTYEWAGPTWAKVSPAGGGEQESHDQTVAVRSHVVLLRDKPHAVQADWLCVWGGLTLNVVAAVAADSNDGDYTLADCLELAPPTA
jgi:head-tail adaptor